jgi:hypothetical protein
MCGRKRTARPASKAAPKPPRKAAKRQHDDDEDDGYETGANKRARLLGKAARDAPDPHELPELTTSVFGPKANVLDRFMDGSELKTDKQINGAYRRAWKAMDELFSTALTREFTKGYFEGPKPPSASEIRQLGELLDLVSTLRMTTGFSGYARKDGVMQHPASIVTQLFGDWKATASKHSEMDKARRDYVETAMEGAVNDGGTAHDIIIAGAKAAIEFTLNYFTAPITAANVFKYSQRALMSAKARTADQVEGRQLAERERLKRIYEELGGNLRGLAAPETASESRGRDWQQGLAFVPESGAYPDAPPSPRREPGLPASVMKEYGF